MSFVLIRALLGLLECGSCEHSESRNWLLSREWRSSSLWLLWLAHLNIIQSSWGTGRTYQNWNAYECFDKIKFDRLYLNNHHIKASYLSRMWSMYDHLDNDWFVMFAWSNNQLTPTIQLWLSATELSAEIKTVPTSLSDDSLEGEDQKIFRFHPARKEREPGTVGRARHQSCLHSKSQDSSGQARAGQSVQLGRVQLQPGRHSTAVKYVELVTNNSWLPAHRDPAQRLVSLPPAHTTRCLKFLYFCILWEKKRFCSW